MIAHIRKKDGTAQLAETHCVNVARLAAERGARIGLEKSAELAGILHDMGKFTKPFADYIQNESAKKGEVPHSPTGAIFAYDRWYPGGTDDDRLAAQMISMVIRGHHGGLLDCIDSTGGSPYLTCIRQDPSPLHYEEALKNFFDTCCPEKELDRLFEEACGEIAAKVNLTAPGDRSYTKGMLTRLLLSCLVDADRWDSACFEGETDSFEPDERADWEKLSEKLEEHLKTYPRKNKISEIRGEVSDLCLEAAKKLPGIYTLTVPTGGGKTLSSLRFALAHAEAFQMERIFYVIPYNTILEQNAADIREALGEYDGILEHYGTFISELDGKEGEEEEGKHTLLAERWNVPIILTSMVQFLDSAYRGNTTSARRFNRLAHSVIIFDEIQALPKRCTTLFEKLIRFLAMEMGCTILLCTATQPSLKLKPEPLLPERFMAEQYENLRRVRLIDESEIPLRYEEAAAKLAELQHEHGSVLIVVNTKKAAKKLFELTVPMLEENVLCIHLSTSMCPAHRLEQLDAMKKRLGKGPVFCVSTALIEAGVNISFPCVVRSLACLPSIIQAAGRCNRHMELRNSLGEVHIWYLPEEDLTHLQEIKGGQKGTQNVKVVPGMGSLDSPEAMEWYFKWERINNGALLDYPWEKEEKNRSVTLTKMFEGNKDFRDGSLLLRRQEKILCMYQAFETAGRAFRVIDQDTVMVLTPYSEGKELIAKLCGNPNLKEKIRLMRIAQKYSVSVFRNGLGRLLEKGAIYPMGDTGIYALRDEFYEKTHLGLVMDSSMMDFLNI